MLTCAEAEAAATEEIAQRAVALPTADCAGIEKVMEAVAALLTWPEPGVAVTPSEQETEKSTLEEAL